MGPVTDVDRINAHGRESRLLLAHGVPGRARITATRDTGERVAGNVVLEVDLLVQLQGIDAYETTLRTPIAGADVAPYAPGCEYGVRVDPVDRTKLTFA